MSRGRGKQAAAVLRLYQGSIKPQPLQSLDKALIQPLQSLNRALIQQADSRTLPSQSLYFCTSKASKLGMFNKLPPNVSVKALLRLDQGLAEALTYDLGIHSAVTEP